MTDPLGTEPATTESPPPATPATPAPTGWQGAADRLIKRVTGNVVVSRVMAVMGIANQAGAPLFAAALAFNTMFAIIPLVFLLAGVLGFFIEDAAQRQAVLEQLIGLVPPLADFFSATLDSLAASRGALSVLGLLGLVWGASNYYGGLDEVMRRIFVGGPVRDQVARRGRGLLTIVVLVAATVITVSISSLWVALDRLGQLEAWRYLLPVLVMAFMALVVLAVYRLVPTAPPSVRASLPPAIVAGVGIGLLTQLFSLLAPWLIGGLSAFGAFATLFGALIWLNFSYQILLWGAAWACLRRDLEAERKAGLAS